MLLKHAIITIFKQKRSSGSAVTNKKLICSLLMQVKGKLVKSVQTYCAAYFNKLTADLVPRHSMYYPVMV